MDFRGPARRIDDYDLPRIGKRIGVGEDEIHALMEVEAAGSPSDRNGRVKMLFEPHKFYVHVPVKDRQAAVLAGLAYPKWGAMPYPADSYPRLLAAINIDQTAALKSASWGLGQIMGENHVAAGYATVQEMVKAFTEDEAAHLEAMVNFLVYNGLDDELRNHQWAALARGYNGPQYAKHGYDKKLAAAYARWARIKDTPYRPAAPVETKPLPAPAPIVPPAHLVEAPKPTFLSRLAGLFGKG